QRVAWVVYALLAFAAPLLTYAELIFPEIPAALLIVYAYRHLRAWHTANPAQRWLVALCVAFLPWLHPRFLLVAAALACFLVVALRAAYPAMLRRSAALATLSALALPICISAAFYLAYNSYVYGS